MTTPEEDDDLAHGFYSFDDLEAERIVHDRSDLHRKQRRYGFPQPVKLGDRQARFPKRAVWRWLRERKELSTAAE
jgi:predicted DNA-binding transcriptional regulator AlpA